MNFDNLPESSKRRIEQIIASAGGQLPSLPQPLQVPRGSRFTKASKQQVQPFKILQPATEIEVEPDETEDILETLRSIIALNNVNTDAREIEIFDQVNRMLRELIGRGERLIMLSTVDGYERGITISQQNVDDLTSALLRKYEIIPEQEVHFSDDWVNWIPRELSDIKIVRVPNKFISPSGAFFPYVNKSGLDLKRYQIIDGEQDKQILNDNCLIYALKQSEWATLNMDILMEVIKRKGYSAGTFVTRRDLSIWAEILGCRIRLYQRNRTRISSNIYPASARDREDLPTIELALSFNHYYIYHKHTGYTRKDIGLNGNKKLNSLQLIECLMVQGKFERDPLLFAQYNHREYKGEIPLTEEIVEQCQSIKKGGTKKMNIEKNKAFICFADSESYIEENTLRHVPFVYAVSNEGITQCFKTFNSLLSYAKEKATAKLNSEVAINIEETNEVTDIEPSKKKRPVALIYFHNLKYDFSTIQEKEKLQIEQIISKDNALYAVKIQYYGVDIYLKDTYKLVAFALAKLPAMFKIPEAKFDNIIYALPNAENLKTGKVIIEKTLKKSPIHYKCYVKGKGKLQLVDYQIKGTRYLIDGRFIVDRDVYESLHPYICGEAYYFRKHFHEYCAADCVILEKSIRIFRESMKVAVNEDVFAYNTISSVVHAAVFKTGIYQKVLPVNGHLQDFIAQAAMGGRVITRENKKWCIDTPLDDLDATSLYPSAIQRILMEFGGYPAGRCQLWDRKSLDELIRKCYYVIEIEFTDDNQVYQPMPFTCYMEDGKRVYTNAMKGRTVIIDKITLEDWVRFQGIKFKPIRAVYWDKGYSDGKEYLQFLNGLFEARVQAKKDKNGGLDSTLKLCLNSQYGKTLIKKNDYKTVLLHKTYKKIIDEDSKTASYEPYEPAVRDQHFIEDNYNQMISYTKVGNTSLFKLRDNNYYHKNMCHVASMILSMSKRIMNEMMALAHSMDIKIYYQDTDSTHIEYSKVGALAQAYHAKYNKDLLGGAFGQFKTDFKIDDHDDARDVHAVRTIILGKKCYYDHTVGVENGEYIEGEHCRMKGINENALIDYSRKQCDGSIEQAFINLLTATKPIPFNMLAMDKPCFEMDIIKGVNTKKKFIRKVAFPGQAYYVNEDGEESLWTSD